MKLMSGRAPGNTCIRSANLLNDRCTNWNTLPYSKNGGGCGAAMRAACIGLYFHNDIDKLIQISIETGRTTHHNPLGYLGSMVAAYFTALAIQGKQPIEWLSLLLTEGLPKSKEYIIKSGREVENNIEGGDWRTFEKCWKTYAEERNMDL
jgi:ADP-ribosylarginine hydrolase